MAIPALCILFIVTATAVQIDIAPVASSYIYRNDHNGPASLIQLGPHFQQDVQPIPAPLPYKLPDYEIAPLPLPYISTKGIAAEDAEDDDETSEYGDGGHDDDNEAAFEKGGGNDYNEEHSAAHGEKGSKGYNSKGHHAKGKTGHYGGGYKEGFHHENKGEKGSHHDEKDAHGKYYAVGKGYKGGDHGHKKFSSKGEEVTGYHKVFNKDEFKKDHDFYDVADNSGTFKKHAYEKANHGSEKGGHEKAGHHKAGFQKGDFGKAGFHAKGHTDDDDVGHSAEEGKELYYKNGGEFEKEGGSKDEKGFAYGDDDDDDDEDDYE